VQEELFYGFSLERHVLANHLLRAMDGFVDLSGVRQHLAPFYSPIGRASIDPELLIRMLIVGYCFDLGGNAVPVSAAAWAESLLASDNPRSRNLSGA
jgi:hypothetical protein